MQRRILFVASEMYPHVRTGGLADVIYSLPRALKLRGVDVGMLLPGYTGFMQAVHRIEACYPIESPFAVELDAQLLRVVFSDNEDPVWLVDCPALYRCTKEIYHEPEDLAGRLNALRFGLLSWAAAQLAAGAFDDWSASIVHCHDWHAALTPLFLSRLKNSSPLKPLPKCVLTVHNLAFQGHFPVSVLDLLGIRPSEYELASVAASGTFCFLETGIRAADKVTTVSPTYAEEILTSEYGAGLEQLLRKRREDLTGILNGVDYSIWHPEHDPHLGLGTRKFELSDRARIKHELQREYGLAVDPEIPLLTFTNRITHQKMADVVSRTLASFLPSCVQFIAMGTGQPELQEQMEALCRNFAGNAVFVPEFQERLEHRFFAGADINLSPSRFEPCGLNPLYSMRYGCVPLVRETGGLRDTITNATSRTIGLRSANGVSFQRPDDLGFAFGLSRALALYEHTEAWRCIQERGMQSAYSWRDSATRYLELYSELERGSGSRRDVERPRVAAGATTSVVVPQDRPDTAPPTYACL